MTERKTTPNIMGELLGEKPEPTARPETGVFRIVIC